MLEGRKKTTNPVILGMMKMPPTAFLKLDGAELQHNPTPTAIEKNKPSAACLFVK